MIHQDFAQYSYEDLSIKGAYFVLKKGAEFRFIVEYERYEK